MRSASLLVVVLATCLLRLAAAESTALTGFPASAEPAKVGARLIDNWLAREFEWASGKRRHVIYPEVCAWYGALRIAELSGDAPRRRQLIARFAPYLTAEGATHISPQAHVDYRVFGVVPLEIFLQTKEPRYLDAGLPHADKQWGETTPDGITREARYWIDDMYMIPALQTQAFRATRERKYLDRAALTAAAYLDRLQKPNGLFVHAPDSPFYWGRGNGWFAAGMAELLHDLPADHPQRARVLEGFRTMMATLLATQSEGGLWRQLVEQPDSWTESSGSAMFAFAFATGVKRGWLDAATYAPATRKAWLALVALLDAEGNVGEVCIGTNKAAREVGSDLATQKKFYLERARRSGDLHGQAAMSWVTFALLEEGKKE